MSALRRIHAIVARSSLADHAARSGWATVQRGLRSRKLARHSVHHDKLRVMLGAGPCKRPGWLATDITPLDHDVVYLDATKPFPFDDGVVELLHSEHVIEHVDFDAGQQMLAECYRVLKPGGRLRISTPDYDRVLEVARAGSDGTLIEFVRAENGARGVPDEYVDDPLFTVNALFSDWGHQFLYSEELLTERLMRAGFTGVTRWEVGVSDHPELCGLEMHGSRIGEAWNDFQSLVLEATKPGTR